jgi:hypothetical protein
MDSANDGLGSDDESTDTSSKVAPLNASLGDSADGFEVNLKNNMLRVFYPRIVHLRA